MTTETRYKPSLGQKILSLSTALLLVISLAACGGGGGGGGGATLTVSPATATVVTGLSIQLTASISGVSWSVNGVAGGNATVGTVDASGFYTAPLVVPTPAVVAVTATTPGATQSASAQITVIPLALAGAGGGYAGTFADVGNLKVARSNHTATLLSSGKVLVAGGIGANGAAIASAELFRPSFSNFSSSAPMKTSRAYHTATQLQNGKVLITGGFDANNNVLAQSELYDPATDAFYATGSMTVPRAYHSATLLLNGMVLIAGGSAASDLTTGAPLDSIELYDPATGKFTSPATSFLTDPRFYHTATLLKNGQVLLAGGIGLNGQKLSTAELFDPAAVASNKISPTGPLATGRWLHTATIMSDGRVLIAGGSSGTIAGQIPSFTSLGSIEIYDPATGLFTDIIRYSDAPANLVIDPLSQLVDTRDFFTTTLLADQTLLSTGGFGLLSTDPTLSSSLATAELFFINGGGAGISTTGYTGSMAIQRANHTATMLPSSGKVLVIGGGGYSSGSFAVTNSAVVYQ